MKKQHVIAVLLVLMLFTFFTSCSSFVDAMLKPSSGSSGSAVSKSGDPLEGYVFINDGGHYHAAKVVTEASTETKGQAEVIDMYSDNKVWADTIETHLADKEELVVGTAVLHQGSGFEDPDKDTLITTSWGAYYITDTSDLFKGKVKAGGRDVSIKHLRIVDTEIEL